MSQEKPREPIPHMNYRQYRSMRKLVNECCNYDNGNCIALDDGEECVCVQSISYSLLCKWFRAAVLSLDKELEADLYPQKNTRRCAECGQPFRAAHKNALYCEACAAKRIRRSKRDWARKNRGKQ
jgi:hypothetical protein